MVEHLETGYLADPFDTVDFTKGIAWVLDNARMLSDMSRAKAERDYPLELQARRYRSLFCDLVTGTRNSSRDLDST